MPRPEPDSCPCGRRDRRGAVLAYAGCCGRYLDDFAHTPAPDAETLMRSRYTAFVVGDARYLEETWHPRTRPDGLTLDATQRWTGLQIVDVEAGGEGDTRGVVEFRAAWRHGRERGVLAERSRFVRQSGHWWYLDGEVDPS